MSVFSSSLFYWRLREHEDSHWTGTLKILRNESPIGRILLHEGKISWAEAAGQKHTLFTALQALAGVGKEDILFIKTVYQEHGGQTNIVTLMEKTGLASFWTLRECMRLHILSALTVFSMDETVEIEEHPENPASPSVLLFTVDELTYADKLLDPTIPPLLKSPGLEVVQVQMKKLGVVYQWPPERHMHDDFLDVGITWYRNRPDAVLPPQMLSVFQPHSTFWVRFFSDAYETILVVAFLPGQDLKPVVDVLWHAPTRFLLELEVETAPLVPLDTALKTWE